jgi:hypothetical protein
LLGRWDAFIDSLVPNLSSLLLAVGWWALPGIPAAFFHVLSKTSQVRAGIFTMREWMGKIKRWDRLIPTGPIQCLFHLQRQLLVLCRSCTSEQAALGQNHTYHLLRCHTQRYSDCSVAPISSSNVPELSWGRALIRWQFPSIRMLLFDRRNSIGIIEWSVALCFPLNFDPSIDFLIHPSIHIILQYLSWTGM